MNKDYYSILGVSKDADAKTIKVAYKQLAKKYHPDISKEPDAEERFKEIAEAYDVVGDEEKRKQYDQFGSSYHDQGFNQRYQQGNYYRGYSAYDAGSARLVKLKWWHWLIIIAVLLFLGWLFLTIFIALLPFIIVFFVIRFLIGLFR